MMDISTTYYSDFSRISNSNIGWFLNKGPAFLHKMLTEDIPEEKNAVLERGTMIHEYLLQPEEFQKDYVVWDKSRPSSAQQEKFCQALAFSTEIEPNRAILSAYKEAYSARAKSDDLMLSEGLKIASTLKDYIDFLKSNDKRKMISPWDYRMLKEIRNNIEAHKLGQKIVWPDGWYSPYSYDPTAEKEFGSLPVEHYHEFHINWEYNGVACKSLLDGFSIDLKDKKVIIYDLKTTQKLWNFEESINTYDYCRQLMYYTMAAKWYIKNELVNQNPDEWTFEWYIVGIDTTGTYEIRVFQFTDKQIKSRFNTIQQALQDISWHQQNNLWEHSKDYYEGTGAETLDINT